MYDLHSFETNLNIIHLTFIVKKTENSNTSFSAAVVIACSWGGDRGNNHRYCQEIKGIQSKFNCGGS